MSNTNGYNTLTKSMNGIITLADGNGTVIEDGTITTGELSTQNISAPDPTADSTIYGDSTGFITIGGVNSTVLCPSTPVTPDEVANKAYVDSVTGGGITLAGTNVWTGQNTFDNYAPLCSTYPSVDDNLANKLYVDNVAGTVGGALLASDNIWTGTNDFQNHTIIGKADMTSNVTLNGEIFIGDATYHPGKNTTIVGENITMQAFTSATMVGDYYFKNTIPNSIVHINTNNNSIPEIDFQTNTSNTTVVTSSIIASGGTTANTGKLQITGGNIVIGQDDHNNSVLITGSVQIGDSLNAPSKNTNICGEATVLQGFTDVNIVAPLIKFRTPASFQSISIDPTVSGQPSLNFYSNTGNITQINSQIVANGGTATNGGNLSINAGAINYGKTDNTTTHTFYGSVNLPSATGSAEFFNTAKTQSLLIDPQTTGSAVSLNFKTNTSSIGTTTGSITTSGGTTLNTGIITHLGASHYFRNSAGTQSIILDASLVSNAVYILFRSLSTSPSVNSAYIRCDQATSTSGSGVLTAQCSEFTAKTGTGNQAVELIPTGTINFKSSSVYDVVSSSLVATGGTATALQGTLAINASTLNMNATTTAFPTGTSITLSSPSSGDYPFYDGGNKCVTISSATTIDNFTTVYDTLYVVPHSNGTNFTISLKGVASDVNTGNVFRIFNNGSSSVTIATTNSTNRLVGPAIARNGNFTYTLGSNASIRVQTIKSSGNPFNQTSANQNGYFISLC